MARFSAKRGIGQVDPTADESNGRGHKASRITSGQRFGEDTQFVPLSQSSQSVGQEEDDAQAADLIQGSQDADDSYNNYTLYGTYPNRIRSWRGILINIRPFTHEDCGCPLL